MYLTLTRNRHSELSHNIFVACEDSTLHRISINIFFCVSTIFDVNFVFTPAREVSHFDTWTLWEMFNVEWFDVICVLRVDTCIIIIIHLTSTYEHCVVLSLLTYPISTHEHCVLLLCRISRFETWTFWSVVFVPRFIFHFNTWMLWIMVFVHISHF